MRETLAIASINPTFSRFEILCTKLSNLFSSLSTMQEPITLLPIRHYRTHSHSHSHLLATWGKPVLSPLPIIRPTRPVGFLGPSP